MTKIHVKSVHTFKSNQRKGHDDMVNVVLEMPWTIWEKVHHHLNVDLKGKPLAKYIKGQLIWEQKNRKEKEK